MSLRFLMSKPALQTGKQGGNWSTFTNRRQNVLWETDLLERFEVAETVPLPVAEVWEAHEDVRFIERIVAPFPSVRLKESNSNTVCGTGTHLTLRFELFGIGADWRMKITHWDPPVCFKDEQVSGPFHVWEHTHHFMAITAQSTRIVDSIQFELNPLVDSTVIRWSLEALFKMRLHNLKQVLMSHSLSNQ
jgi:ligand-binding SRPBCC domain-containing protein